MRRVSPISLACLALFAASGTERALASDTLGPISVTGSTIEDRFASSATDPVSTVSFTARQVEDQHARNLIEVLRSVSGITADLQGDGDTIKIKLRGVENQRYMGEKPGVAIVVDGVPVFERTGKVNIDLDNIESIKVIKGGASYLYGEDALAGAVVITTKRGAAQKGFKAEADLGSHGYRRYLARGGFATDELSGHLQYSDRDQDGYYLLSRAYARTWSGNVKHALNGRSDLSFGFENSDRFRDREGSVTGVTAAAIDPKGSDGGRGYTRNFNVDLSRYNLSYSNDIDDKSNLLAVAYQYRDDTTFWSAPIRFTGTGAATTAVDDYSALNDYTQVQRGIKTEYRNRFGRLALMGGLELKRNTFDNFSSALKSYCNTAGCKRGSASTLTPAGAVQSDDFTTERTQAAYGEVKLALTGATTATLNLRHDRIAIRFQAAPVAGNGNVAADRAKEFDVDSYRLGLTHSLGEATSLYGAVSTGFRAPTSEQLFRGQTTTNALVQGNPDLKPEKSTTFEVGLRHQFSLGAWPSSLNAAAFQVDRKDFILDSNGQYASSNNAAGGGSQFRNIGGARSRGLELELRTRPAHGWSFDAAYTYLDAYFTRYESFYQTLGNGNGSYRTSLAAAQAAPGGLNSNFFVAKYDNTGKKLPRVPPHQMNLRANYMPAPGWTFSGELDYKARSWADEINQEKIPARTLFNLTAQYGRKLAGWPGAVLSAFVRVENVLNKRYFLTARGTNDSDYNGVYNAEDLSIVVDPGRAWRIGVSLQF